MKQTKYYFLILMILLTGCDNRKCLSSHTETILMMMPVYNGNSITMIPQFYPNTICDIYENNTLPEQKK